MAKSITKVKITLIDARNLQAAADRFVMQKKAGVVQHGEPIEIGVID